MQHFSFPLQYIVSSFLFLVYIISFLVYVTSYHDLEPQLCCIERPQGFALTAPKVLVSSLCYFVPCFLLAALLLYTPEGPYPSRRLFTRAKHFARSFAALHATLSLYSQLCCPSQPRRQAFSTILNYSQPLKNALLT